jgi:hypothetical protein
MHLTVLEQLKNQLLPVPKQLLVLLRIKIRAYRHYQYWAHALTRCRPSKIKVRDLSMGSITRLCITGAW